MKKIILLTAIVGLTACNRRNNSVVDSDNRDNSASIISEKDTYTDTGAGTTAPLAGTTGIAPSANAPIAAAAMPTDAEIAAIVVAANTADIAQGKVAQTKTTSKEVKALAQQMVNDHSQNNKDASALAAKLKLKPQENDMSKFFATNGQQSISKLQGLKGKDFDKAYIDGEVKMHQDVLNTIDQTLLPNAKNAELKALLEKTRPVIEAHLQHAKHLQSTYK